MSFLISRRIKKSLLNTVEALKKVSKENKIVKSKEGQAVVFDSHNLHKGISSKIIPVRYALNIVCKEND